MAMAGVSMPGCFGGSHLDTGQLTFGFLTRKKSTTEHRGPLLVYNPDFKWFVGNLPLPMPSRTQVRQIMARLEAAPKYSYHLIRSITDDNLPHPKGVIQHTKNYLGKENILQSVCKKYGTKVNFRVDSFGMGDDGYYLSRLVIVGILDVPKQLPNDLEPVDTNTVVSWKVSNGVVEPKTDSGTRSVARLFLVSGKLQLTEPKPDPHNKFDLFKDKLLCLKPNSRRMATQNNGQSRQVFTDCTTNDNKSDGKMRVRSLSPAEPKLRKRCLCKNRRKSILCGRFFCAKSKIVVRSLSENDVNVLEIVGSGQRLDRVKSASLENVKEESSKEVEGTEPSPSTSQASGTNEEEFDPVASTSGFNIYSLLSNPEHFESGTVVSEFLAKQKKKKQARAKRKVLEDQSAQTKPDKKRARIVAIANFVYRPPDRSNTMRERFSQSCQQLVGIISNFNSVDLDQPEAPSVAKVQKVMEFMMDKMLHFEPTVYRRTEDEIQLMEDVNERLNTIVERLRRGESDFYVLDSEHRYFEEIMQPAHGHR